MGDRLTRRDREQLALLHSATARAAEEEHGEGEDREHEQERMNDRATGDRDDQQDNSDNQPKHLELLHLRRITSR
jgi:hypothetical protein